MQADLTIIVPEGPTFVIPGEALEVSATTASGPGGQNVNKVATRIELRFDLNGSAVFSDAQKAVLRTKLRTRLGPAGDIIVTSQKTRTQLRNLDDAREKLAALIAAALFQPKTRRPTAPSRGQKARRLDEKKKDGARKASRASVRRYDD
jgi:ribosome-associated protein